MGDLLLLKYNKSYEILDLIKNSIFGNRFAQYFLNYK